MARMHYVNNVNMNYEFNEKWKMIYLVLVFVRLSFALTPSYLHPDEHFQGPEVMAGTLLSFPCHKTWEFTSSSPIRSIFPMLPVYGVPMLLLRLVSTTLGYKHVSAATVFWFLRIVMFALSFGLGDLAISNLISSPRQRRLTLLMIASSYVTLTWQVHTFSNAIETVTVLWTIVFMKRLTEMRMLDMTQLHAVSVFSKQETRRYEVLYSAVLAMLVVLGSFNRITFPAFVIIPGLNIAGKVWHRPSIWITFSAVIVTATAAAIVCDTVFYSGSEKTFLDLFHHPIITPLNNLLYNTKSANLALHGTHPYYQHFLVNLPVLLGPAVVLISTTATNSVNIVTAVTGVFIVSCFSHQEARFLLPAVPLLLSSVRIPQRFWRIWIMLWVIFNLFMCLFMGIYHQGGVVRAQLFLGEQSNVGQAYWWKTYSPPTWLLGYGSGVETIDLLGIGSSQLEDTLCSVDNQNELSRVLVAPRSATYLDSFRSEQRHKQKKLHLSQMWETRTHLNLDDMDIPIDGLVGTLKRVVGRRGLIVWRVECR